MFGWDEANANYKRDGVYAKEDYKYWAMYSYLKLSPSFEAVRCHMDNLPCDFPLPADLEEVMKVVTDFREIYKYEVDKWWSWYGKTLFSARAKDPEVEVCGLLSSQNKEMHLEWQHKDSLVVRIPLNQSKGSSVERLKRILDDYDLKAVAGELAQPRYKLLTDKIRKSTLSLAYEVLSLYMSKKSQLPLWYIGNFCAVIPGQTFTQEQFDKMSADEFNSRKLALSAATSRLVRTGLIIAENAARGRFPSAQRFPEAQLSIFQRKNSTGRPTKQMSQTNSTA